jgi:acetylornithine/succinyldiaminopimelate/putrescine aminotransferase
MVAHINRALSQSGERLAANPALTAFHLAGPTLSFEVRQTRAAQLAASCRANGILVGVSSPTLRIRIAPPLTIPADQLKTALKVIEKAAESL